MRDVPPVRLEVRDVGDAVHEVRQEREWPLARTRWTPLYPHADGRLADDAPGAAGQVAYDCVRGAASFAWTVPRDLELTGPMTLRLHVEVRDAAELLLFAGVRKLRAGREMTFEGSYGFGRDLVTRGWLRVAALGPGEVRAVEIALLPSATWFRAGDVVRLDVQGRYFFRRHPLFGQFPAGYEASRGGTGVLHVGGARDAHLRVPIV
jgi:hypothetical protein